MIIKIVLGLFKSSKPICKKLKKICMILVFNIHLLAHKKQYYIYYIVNKMLMWLSLYAMEYVMKLSG